MRYILGQGWFRGFVVAIMLAGVIASTYGAYRYLDSDNRLKNNLAYQMQQQEDEVEVQTESQAMGLVNADIERRELERSKNEALVIGGGGLVTLALGWILLDLSRSYTRRRQPEDHASEAEPSTA